MIAHSLYAFVATLGFAVLFQVPMRLLIPVGLGGGTGWLVYHVAYDFGHSAIFGTFFAAIWVGGYGEAAARIARRPATLFATCAMIPLVPGRGIFETMVAAVHAQPLEAVAFGLRTLGAAGALASGLALVTALIPGRRRLNN